MYFYKDTQKLFTNNSRIVYDGLDNAANVNVTYWRGTAGGTTTWFCRKYCRVAPVELVGAMSIEW